MTAIATTGPASAPSSVWVSPIYLRTKYAPGAWSALFLQAPIGTAYIHSAKAAWPITRDEWIKAGVVGGVFIVFGVGAPNVLDADTNSTYPFTVKQMGPYKVTSAGEQPS